MKKRIEKLMFLFIIIIIAIIIIVVNIIKDDNEENLTEDSDSVDVTADDTPEEDPYTGGFGKVSNGDEYFVIKDILDNYCLYIKYINGDISSEETNLKETGITALKNMLDESYISALDITEETLSTYADKYTQSGNYSKDVEYSLIINELYAYALSYTETLYFVDISINEVSLQVLIKVDFTNRVFSMFLSDYIEEKEYSIEMDEEDIKISESSIDENAYNTFSYNSVSDKDLAKEYYRIVSTLLITDSNKAYNLLDEEYRTTEYSDYDTFKNYIDENYDQINNATLNKYNVTTEDDRVIYKLSDSEGVIYIVYVNIDYILDYSIEIEN